MATQTMEQMLGLDDPSQFPQDFPLPGDVTVDRSGAVPGASTGGPTSRPLDGGTETIQGEAPTTDPNTPPVDPTSPDPGSTDGTARTKQGGGPNVPPGGQVLNPVTGDPGPPPTVAAPPAAAPTPASTDYSQLNQILSQLLAGQQQSSAGNTDFRNNIRNTVMSLIKSGSAPVDPNDPTISSATQAFRGEGERALALLREKQAEASRAGGRTAGSEESAMKGGYEDLGNATGAYTANLQMQELNARRQQLMQAASLGAGVSNADESNALQSQIAQLDAQIKELSLKTNAGLTQQGITNQNAQFYDNLANEMGNQTNSMDTTLAAFLRLAGQGA